MREAFNLFHTTDQSSMIDPEELKAAMYSLGFETQHPTVYEVAVDFEEFLDNTADKLTRQGVPHEGDNEVVQSL
ncbi:centrin, putative [Perkinsus marinus ATCC 50983]|uniref:Centrin, putative n=1 Tax=Perkinsus marinus (strain ATCC 50983 / TXsc) TaxID=423536 RepID=C5K758_PERM5|nr:centrin, putative [Perkinsus marinus ATCC 50983]EER19393.1 centrin, putative [Perkinsus marinus ATCC 50983]|eukprot:XP_002787597.1 centrin, putative [Perkinsus marinus ATCC 50983]